MVESTSQRKGAGGSGGDEGMTFDDLMAEQTVSRTLVH